MTLTQITLWGIGGLAALAAGAILFLPREVTVTRTGSVSASPDAIVALAASNRGYQRFNPYLSADPNLKIAMFGPESGVGSGFDFDGKDGRGRQTVASVGADAVHFAIDLGPMGTPTQVIAATAQGEGSLVTWRMQADLGFNPLARVAGLFMDGMVGPTFERGIRNLDTALSAS